MSMILEALRKSEAERQRGRAPGLFVEQRPARATDRRLPAWAWGLGTLLVLVLLAWGWREWQRAAPAVTSVPAADAVVEARPAQVAERMGEAPGAPVLITLAPEAPPVRVAKPAAPALPAVSDPAPSGPAEVAAAPAAIQAPAGAPLPPGRAAAPAPMQDAAAPPAVDTPDWLPGLGTLAADERAALPPLKLSMHVFSDDASQRFVILDGQRLGQGASPAAGVVLEEIRRDGLVLSVNGQRLLLARP